MLPYDSRLGYASAATIEGDWELRSKLEPEPELNIPGAEPVELGEMGNAEAVTRGL